MQVLVALARQPGTILSRDDLIDCCWDGRIVGDASVNRVLSLLRTALRELGGDTVTIETVPRVGYRLLLADSDSDVEGESDDGPPSQAAPRPQRKPLLFVALAIVIVAMAIVGASLLPRPVERLEAVSIAMLPLIVEEGVDPLYATGMEAEIRSKLARSRNTQVTASESARQMAQQGLDPAEIGKTLGTDFVWQGTIGNSADRVVISGRLIDTQDGRVVWNGELASAPGSAQSLPLRVARALLEALGMPAASNVTAPNASADDFRLYLTALGLIRGGATPRGARSAGTGCRPQSRLCRGAGGSCQGSLPISRFKRRRTV